MALKVNSDIALTGSLTVSGSYGLAASDIPSLAASKITSGTFSTARIPSLAASKITSGTFADARIASAANWNTAYGWGNHASAGYSTAAGVEDNADVTDTTNVVAALTAGTNVQIAANGTISATDTNTQLTDAQVRSKISGTGLIGYNSSTGVISTTADNYANWNLVDGGDNVNRVDSTEYVKFGGADISGTGTSSDPFVIATPNTTYSAGSGLDLSGTTFSVETDLRDGITHVGVSTNNYVTFDNTNNRIDFYAGGVHVARMESDGDLHVKGDVIAFSSIFA